MDLVFNILARDKGASRTLKDVGEAAMHSANRIEKLSGATALLAATVPALGGLGAVAAGPLLALPAAATAGAAAFGVLAFALKDVKEAFSSSSAEAELKGFAKSTAEFVEEGRNVSEMLSSWQRLSQGEFFKPLVGGLDQVTNAYMPVLEQRVPALTGLFGEMGRSLLSVAASGDNVGRVTRILDSTSVSTRNLSRTLEAGLDLVLGLGAAGSKAWERLSADIARGTRSMQKYFADLERDGSLDRIFDTGISGAERLMDAVASLGRSLMGLFASEGAAEAADSLFTILETGVGVIGTLIDLFSALPPSVQSTVVTLGALGYVGSTAFQMAKNLGSALSLTAIALETTAVAGGRAAAGVTAAGTALTRAAGPIGVAVAVAGLLAVAMSDGSTKAEGLKIDVSRLAETMKIFGQTGKVTGELARTTGGSFGSLAGNLRKAEDALVRLKATKEKLLAGGPFLPGDDLSKAQPDLVAWTRENIDATAAQKQFTEATKATAHEIAQLARSGDLRGAAAAADQFRSAFASAGYSAEWINGHLREYTEISGGMTIVQYNTAKASATINTQQQILNGTWDDAINKAGSLKEALDILNGVNIGYERTMINAEAAIDKFAKVLESGKGSFDRTTEAGQATRDAILDIIEVAGSAAQQEYDRQVAMGNGAGAAEAAMKTWQNYIGQIKDLGKQWGLSKEEMDKFLETNAKAPSFKTVPVTTPGAKESTTQLENLNKQIEGLKDKQVKISEEGSEDAGKRVNSLQTQINNMRDKTVIIRAQVQRTGGGLFPQFEDPELRGQGGIDIAMAGGGITSRWLRSPTVLAGERGTEAYISMTAPKERSRQILREATAMLGGPGAVWPQQSSGGGEVVAALEHLTAVVMASAGRPVQINLSAQGTSGLDALFLNWLQRLIASAGGNVQTVLGQNG